MRWITRTIKSVIVITKCVNADTMEVEDCTLRIGNVPPEKIEKTVNKVLENSPYKLVKVLETFTEELIIQK